MIRKSHFHPVFLKRCSSMPVVAYKLSQIYPAVLFFAITCRRHDLCIRYMPTGGGGTFPYRGCFKMHTILITPSCSPLTTVTGAEAAQHTRCSSGAPGHTRTRTRIYTRRRAPLVRATNRGSITDRPHHPARKYLQQQQQQWRESTAPEAVITQAGCRSIRATTPPAPTLASSTDGEAPPHKSGHFVTKESLTRCC